MSNRKQLMTRRDFMRLGGLAVGAMGLPIAPQRAVAEGIASIRKAKVEPWHSQNPFLSGAFTPVFDERDDADLTVDGDIPERLRGVFMRNGPNPQFQPDARYAYPFDGTGMIHAIYLEGGRARYRNRWVSTQELVNERQAGHRLYNSTFAEPPYANLANTNIVHHAGRFLALYEAGVPYELDRDIRTVGPFNFNGKLPGVMSAHPKVDPVTHELLSIEYNLHSGALLYTRANREGQLDRAVPFQAPWPVMVHDIAMTEHYVVVFVCPLVFDWSKSGPPARWQPQRGTMIALVPRDARTGSDIKWIHGPAFFNWHTVNAHEESGRISVIFPWYESFSFNAPPARLELHRLTIDLKSGAVDDRVLDEQPCEFGRVNEAYLGRQARFGYVGLRAPRKGESRQAGTFEAIARYDLVTGAKTVHNFPAGVTVCEPVFAADPQGKSEDDGYILTFTQESGSTTGQFLIFDAHDLGQGPLAVVHLPRRVPAGLHGSWVPT